MMDGRIHTGCSLYGASKMTMTVTGITAWTALRFNGFASLESGG
jgi:hypothetical protein